jgi:hypothetical protein
MTIDSAKLEELRSKHGEVWVVSNGDEDIVFRRPLYDEWSKFNGACNTGSITQDGSCSIVAGEELVQRVVLSHTGPELLKLANTCWGDIYTDIIIEIRVIQDRKGKDRAKKYGPGGAMPPKTSA